jgi:hypothetical protein
MFAGMSFSGSFVHLDGVRTVLPFRHTTYSVIRSSSFHHGGLGHDHVPYVLGQ